MAEIVGTVVAKVHELQSHIKAVSRLLWQDQENIAGVFGCSRLTGIYDRRLRRTSPRDR